MSRFITLAVAGCLLAGTLALAPPAVAAGGPATTADPGGPFAFLWQAGLERLERLGGWLARLAGDPSTAFGASGGDGDAGAASDPDGAAGSSCAQCGGDAGPVGDPDGAPGSSCAQCGGDAGPVGDPNG